MSLSDLQMKNSKLKKTKIHETHSGEISELKHYRDCPKTHPRDKEFLINKETKLEQHSEPRILGFWIICFQF